MTPSTTAAPEHPTTSAAPPTSDDGPAFEAPEPTQSGVVERIIVAFFIMLPFAALIAAVPIAWGGWLGWHDILIGVVMYELTGHGVTIGFHRYFTHRAFKPKRGLKIALGIVGSMAFQGEIIRWVADHRKHHKFSDREGDPHSPWRYGNSVPALIKGLGYAHMGWLFDPEKTPIRQYAPDLLTDKDIVRINKLFPLWAVITFMVPALVGGLWSMSWHGAITAFFWASLVRIGVLHHVTWSINSICHAAGNRPFRSRDKSGNVWWLAPVSFGESWHNLHHSDPTCARHGVLRGQIDTSARLIWLFEKLGWVEAVRWPVTERLAMKRVEAPR
jgi:stearoyl-CoA desaturase (delta-9 desaturase)